MGTIQQKHNRLLLFTLIILLWTQAQCVRPASKWSSARKVGAYPFQNTSLSWSDRVDNLVSLLTLDEIQDQMSRGGAGNYGGPAPAIPRLGIGAYQWSTECLRGDVGAAGNATAFPQAIGLGASFSKDLLYRVAAATGKEVRGKHNDFVKQGSLGDHTGASCFSPVINIARDPRWGRIQETYGEDPFLSGVLSEHFVRGLQGNDSRFVQASAGCKHFDVHGGPEDFPVSRFSFDAQVSDVDWRTTFLPAFKKCVEAGTFSLMCSYNRINGVPACANQKLLSEILRNEWNFTGYVVSDEGAIENIISQHHYLNNSVDTVAACVNAGTNLELSGNLQNPVFMSLVDAVSQGKLSEDVVRERVKPLFYTRMRLGEFDPPDNNPYASLNASVAESPEHQALAIEAAIKTFVLLKNTNNFLPLNPAAFTDVTIVGPMADNAHQLFGDYSPNQDRSFTKTPLQGLQELFPNIRTGKACADGTPCTSYSALVIMDAVAAADLVFVALGTGQAVEAEGHDRPDVNLPGYQAQLLADALMYSNNSKVVLLLFNAGPLNLTVFDQVDRIVAILECFLPAQATGDALAAVLVNKGGNSSPGGRLPITWPKLASQIPPIVNYSMVGRTYRYIDTEPLYPFGYGLSYTNFTYQILAVTYYDEPKRDISVQVDVANIGNITADEVVQCYFVWENKTLPVPRIQLIHFDRVTIPAGGYETVQFDVTWENWAYWDGQQWSVQTGVVDLNCGGQQPFQNRSAPSNVLSVQFNVYGDELIDTHHKHHYQPLHADRHVAKQRVVKALYQSK
ncbi:hypothetical protein BsWGS_21959 [Bradybaena similaris]